MRASVTVCIGFIITESIASGQASLIQDTSIHLISIASSVDPVHLTSVLGIQYQFRASSTVTELVDVPQNVHELVNGVRRT